MTQHENRASWIWYRSSYLITTGCSEFAIFPTLLEVEHRIAHDQSCNEQNDPVMSHNLLALFCV